MKGISDMKKIISLVHTTILCVCTFSGCAHKHDFGNQVVKEPTCTEEGIRIYQCIDCGYQYKEAVECLGHDYVDGDILVNKSCTDKGKREIVCTRCGEKYVKIIPAGHDFVEEIVKEATCHSEGEKRRTCSRCKLVQLITIPKKEHSFNNNQCVYCGVQKVNEIKANTWYTYNPLPSLEMQNCVSVQVIPASNHVSVLAYRICSHCHIASKSTGFYTVYFDKNTSEFYKCDECGETTLIQFRLNY